MENTMKKRIFVTCASFAMAVIAVFATAAFTAYGSAKTLPDAIPDMPIDITEEFTDLNFLEAVRTATGKPDGPGC